ncbi:Malonyl CoA-acyl carrier protein transacylase [Caenispirillum salinarum AK4]|uniref:Malonyl CoA-acyl carrier protein transacylase n=2 Tax=Caenispirillum TaxID=414051 RepID=K9GYJ5_9PROT|nr:Malonyl CoA-acyl carrier protein transacylase [Caenispirillum salinarum AK4]
MGTGGLHAMTVQDRTLIDRVRAVANDRTHDRGIIFISGERQETRVPYARLWDDAGRMLSRLRAAGVAPGHELVLQIEDQRTFLTLFWACLRGGIVPVPLHVGARDDYLRKFLKVWKTLSHPWLATTDKRLPQICEFWMAEGADARALEARALLIANAEDGAERFEPADEVAPQPDALAFLQFSSGSTGDPKGVTVTHRNLLVNVEALADRAGMTPDDTALSWMPITHDMGLICITMTAQLRGLTLCLMPTPLFIRRPLLWLKKAHEHRATMLCSPNFGYHFFLSAYEGLEERPDWDLSSVRLIWNGAEPISVDLCHAFQERLAVHGLPGTAILPCYGLAEGTVGVAVTPPGTGIRTHRVRRDRIALGEAIVLADAADTDTDAITFVDCGPAIDNVEMAILDAAGRLLPEGTVGRIAIRGPSVTDGYYNNEDATAAARLDDGWLDTGDIGFLDDGRLTVTGRAKELIIVNGLNHHPHDIEQAVETLDDVKPGNVVACGVPGGRDGRGAEELVLFLRWTGGDDGFSALADRARAVVLERVGLPVAQVVPVRKIPKTTSGKIQRVALAQQLVADRAQTAAAQALTGPRKAGPDDARLLADIIAVAHAITGRDIAPDVRFADAGFTSLVAVTFADHLGTRLGRRLPPSLVFDHPTPLSLARRLGGGTPNAAPAVALAAEEPVALVGVGLRLPGGVVDMDSFWRLLEGGVDAITGIPADRWDAEALHDPDAAAPGRLTIRHGGFLDGVDLFDNRFFGVSAAEAECVDPQQRLLLETAYEAMEDAGLDLGPLAGGPVGVFVGLSNADYTRKQLHSGDLARIGTYSMTGTAFSTAAGRLSYGFGFQGPSLTVDTACSSSLVAVHLAAQSLRRGECCVALAAGANLILSPEVHAGFSRLDSMARDGRCKTFDARADGYCRSEGVAVVVLKRLSAAQADGDRILAVLNGGALNQDGASNGLTAPNGPAQESLMRQALAASGTTADAVGYVEAHGTGTPLGDGIELNALNAVYGAAKRPVYVGSVKSNIGHTEATAGLAGLLKAVLAVRHGIIPPSLHIQAPTPQLDWTASGLCLPIAPTPWPEDTPRTAAVSSFGFSGTNAHWLVSAAPVVKGEPVEAPEALPLCLSARTPDALEALRTAWLDRLAEDDAAEAFPALAATAAHRRTAHPWRLAVAARTAAEALEVLEGAPLPTRAVSAAPGRTVFVYPGQGGQWPGMARDLATAEPVFAEALTACAEALRPHVEWDPALLTEGAPDALLDGIDRVQPALFAVSVALTRLWQSKGVHPDAVVGHSLGEVAAAHVAGILSLEDAARVIAVRSRLLTRIAGQGGMMVVDLPMAEAEALCEGAGGGEVSVAVRNATGSTVIAGDPAVLEALAADLEAREVFCRRVKVDVASHSPQVEPLLDDLRAELAGITPHAGRIPLVSTVHGRVLEGEEAGPDYWVENLRRPVLFADAVAALADDGARWFVECAPHPTLVSFIDQECDGVAALPSLRRDEPGPREFTAAAAALWAAGYPVAWRGFVPRPAEPAHLPRYPWQRERFWLEDATPVDRATDPLLGRRTDLAGEDAAVWETTVSTAALPWLADHKVAGSVVLPAAAYTVMALRAAPGRSLRRMDFRDMLVIEDGASVTVQTRRRGARVEVLARDGETWRLLAEGTLADAADPPAAAVPPVLEGREDAGAFYAGLDAAGLNYGPAFRLIDGIARTEGEAVADLTVPAPGGPVTPALLDACLQAAAPLGLAETRVPVALSGVTLFGPAPDALRVTVRREGETARILATAPDGTPVLVVDALHLSAGDAGRDAVADAMLRLSWTDAGPAPAAVPGPVTLMGASDPAFKDALVAAGAEITTDAPRILWRAPAAGDLDALDPAEVERWTLTLAADLTALADRAAPPASVRVVTSGADADPLACALTALARTARAEHPELGVAIVDLDRPVEAAALLAPLPAEAAQVRLRDGRILTPRLTPDADAAAPLLEVPAAEVDAYRAVLARPGDAGSMRFLAADRPAPDAGQVEVSVEAVGLNFINLLSALGLYPGAPEGFRALGIECAGHVTRVGPGVEAFEPGDAVMGIVDHCLSSHALADARLVVPAPAGLTMAEAAALPVAYATAAIGLQDMAGLEAGETVLIHAASGGVGRAAIALAQAAGATIIATAGTPEKRAALAALEGVAHVFDSRSTTFREGVMQATGGRGVDVVLNCLAGPLLEASLDCLAPFGRFVEIGKRDLWGAGSVPMAALRHGTAFHVLDLDRMSREKPARVGRVLARIANGTLPPLPVTEVPFADASKAFAEMAAARHTGKLVLTRHDAGLTVIAPDDAPAFDETGTALVTGGAGAVGTALIDDLVARGCTNIVVLGRSGTLPDDRAEAWRAAGATVKAVAMDVADAGALARVLAQLEVTMPPLTAVIHAAGVLDDASLSALTPDQVVRVMAPKVRGALNLHRLTQGQPLEAFVVISSAAALLGPMGQGAYAAANAFMDGLIAARRAAGLPGTALDLGPVAGAGLAARADRLANVLATGLRPMPAEAVAEALHRALLADTPRLALLDPLSTFADPLWQGGEAPAPAEDGSDAADGLRAVLVDLPTQDARLAHLEDLLTAQAAAVLRCAESKVDRDTPFKSLGLDSLLAMQLRNRLIEATGVTVAVTTFWNTPTITAFARLLLAELMPAADDGAAVTDDDYDALSDEDAEDLLLARL